MAKKNNTKNIAIGAALAAGAGYVVGLLTAPKSGKNTRNDLKKKANKAKIEGEKQLKNLHSELNELLDKANNQKDKAGVKANKELKKAVDSAKKSKEKTKLVLSAIHNGDADDPNLKSAIKEATKAKQDLVKFLKK